jgi:hypothetical protein
VSREPDAPEQSRHPQRSENHPDGSPEQADHEAEDDGRGESRAFGGSAQDRPSQQIDAVPGQDRGDHGEEEPRWKLVGQKRAGDGADHRRRPHPGDDAPVDAAGTGMPIAAGRRRRCADRDVRAGSGGGVTGEEQDRREAKRAQDETDRRAEIPGRERGEEG